MVPAHSIKVSRVSMYSGSCCPDLDFAYGAFTLSGRPSQTFRLSLSVTCAVRTPQCTHHGLGSSGFARRYSRNRCFFLFLRLLRCFSSPGSPHNAMDSRYDHMIAHMRFPYSDISGSWLICSSPELFAAYHVFRRLLVPRHPPCALVCLIISDSSMYSVTSLL